MRPLLLSIALLLPMTVAAEEKKTELLPKKIAEDCFELKAGDTVAYGFEAAAPLEFNVHYHEGEAVKFPVQPAPSQAAKDGRFSAPVDQTYCLMWKNTGDKPVALRHWSEKL